MFHSIDICSGIIPLGSHTSNIDQTIDLSHALDLSKDRARAIEYAIEYAIERSRRQERDIDDNRDRAIENGIEIARSIIREYEIATDRNLARDLTNDLALDTDPEIKLALVLVFAKVHSLDLNDLHTRARVLDLARDIARDIALDSDRAIERAIDRDIARNLDRAISRAFDRALDIARDLDLDIHLFRILLIDDINSIATGRYEEISNATTVYDHYWNDFHKMLEECGCKYWSDAYTNIWEQRFKTDIETLEIRLRLPREYLDKGAAEAAKYLSAQDYVGKKKKEKLRFKIGVTFTGTHRERVLAIVTELLKYGYAKNDIFYDN